MELETVFGHQRLPYNSSTDESSGSEGDEYEDGEREGSKHL
jgi:hypothetical protein